MALAFEVEVSAFIDITDAIAIAIHTQASRITTLRNDGERQLIGDGEKIFPHSTGIWGTCRYPLIDVETRKFSS
ncbi:MAG: hypothetical protein ACKVHP_23905, partial [Verrucomicrobiales bacterium]